MVNKLFKLLSWHHIMDQESKKGPHFFYGKENIFKFDHQTKPAMGKFLTIYLISIKHLLKIKKCSLWPRRL